MEYTSFDLLAGEGRELSLCDSNSHFAFNQLFLSLENVFFHSQISHMSRFWSSLFNPFYDRLTGRETLDRHTLSELHVVCNIHLLIWPRENSIYSDQHMSIG